MIESKTLEKELHLPKLKFRRSPGSSIQYGLNEVISRYCKQPYSRMLDSPLPGVWQHGWVPQHWQKDPRMVYQSRVLDLDSQIYVAREDEEKYLIREGFINTRAIGLPLIYIDKKDYIRRPNSLLVMPMHSLDSVERKSDFKSYRESLRKIVIDFDEVVACIHPSCIKHGYWLDIFRDLDVPCVTGAGATDANALERMGALMQQFEYVTSNGFGSHLAYASYFGAKPSLYGDIIEPKIGDYTNSRYYKKQPELLDIVLKINTGKTLREEMPDLFKHPAESEIPMQWGKCAVGADNKLDSEELMRLLEYNMSKRIKRSVSTCPQKLKSKIIGDSFRLLRAIK